MCFMDTSLLKAFPEVLIWALMVGQHHFAGLHVKWERGGSKEFRLHMDIAGLKGVWPTWSTQREVDGVMTPEKRWSINGKK